MIWITILSIAETWMLLTWSLSIQMTFPIGTSLVKTVGKFIISMIMVKMLIIRRFRRESNRTKTRLQQVISLPLRTGGICRNLFRISIEGK